MDTNVHFCKEDSKVALVRYFKTLDIRSRMTLMFASIHSIPTQQHQSPVYSTYGYSNEGTYGNGHSHHQSFASETTPWPPTQSHHSQLHQYHQPDRPEYAKEHNIVGDPVESYSASISPTDSIQNSPHLTFVTQELPHSLVPRSSSQLSATENLGGQGFASQRPDAQHALPPPISLQASSLRAVSGALALPKKTTNLTTDVNGENGESYATDNNVQPGVTIDHPEDINNK